MYKVYSWIQKSCPQKKFFLKQYKPGSSRTSSRKKLKSFEFEMSVNFVCKCLQFILTLSGNNEGFTFFCKRWLSFIDLSEICKKCDLILKGVDCSGLFMCPNIECAYKKSYSILSTLDDIKVS